MLDFERLLLAYLKELDVAALLTDSVDSKGTEAEAQRWTAQVELYKTKSQLSMITQAIESGGNLKTLVARLGELE